MRQRRRCATCVEVPPAQRPLIGQPFGGRRQQCLFTRGAAQINNDVAPLCAAAGSLFSPSTTTTAFFFINPRLPARSTERAFIASRQSSTTHCAHNPSASRADFAGDAPQSSQTSFAPRLFITTNRLTYSSRKSRLPSYAIRFSQPDTPIFTNIMTDKLNQSLDAIMTDSRGKSAATRRSRRTRRPAAGTKAIAAPVGGVQKPKATKSASKVAPAPRSRAPESKIIVSNLVRLKGRVSEVDCTDLTIAFRCYRDSDQGTCSSAPCLAALHADTSSTFSSLQDCGTCPTPRLWRPDQALRHW